MNRQKNLRQEDSSSLMYINMESRFKIPTGVTAKKHGNAISIAGKLGEIKNTFSNPLVKFDIKGDEVVFTSDVDTRKSKKITETYTSTIKSMAHGVEKGYTYKMKICFTHFPITAKVDGNTLLIENFLGERTPRKARLFPGVKVVVAKQDITLTGPDLYAVSQSAANIEQAARITRRDRRVFQDGIYITSKND
jgi:large subunit ribosomal protein L6